MKENENKKDIVLRLKLLLIRTRAGSDICDLTLNETQDTVTILFKNGCKRNVNIACDSGIAIIQDVINAL